jgi:dephospho-CoA kinase
MIKVGITGGIGSGKSIISQVFSKLGVPVYNADLSAGILMNNDPEIINGLITKFGNNIYINSLLDRKKLAEIIFTDKEALKYVNGLVHPAVGKDSEKWFLCHKHNPYVIKEAALFFESGTYKEIDLMITVIAPLNLRYKRVIERDKVTMDQVKKRMESQLSDDEKIIKSDFVIINDEIRSVLEQVLFLHQHICNDKINN